MMLAQGGEGTQAGACSPCEDNNLGESRCMRKAKWPRCTQ
jgi:hypothetical protein